ncbi:MAG: hypothetical protein ACI8UO_002868 [Verrucomicrobiales bacterium]|jgi:hypothetical protein
MKTQNLLLALLASFAVAISLSSCGGDGHDHDHGDHDHGDSSSATADPTADGYPLKTCVVSGEELGSMGEPVIVKHGDVTVKLCCKSCIDDFNAEPEKFVAKLNQ